MEKGNEEEKGGKQGGLFGALKEFRQKFEAANNRMTTIEGDIKQINNDIGEIKKEIKDIKKKL